MAEWRSLFGFSSSNKSQQPTACTLPAPQSCITNHQALPKIRCRRSTLNSRKTSYNLSIIGGRKTIMEPMRPLQRLDDTGHFKLRRSQLKTPRLSDTFLPPNPQREHKRLPIKTNRMQLLKQDKM